MPRSVSQPPPPGDWPPSDRGRSTHRCTPMSSKPLLELICPAGSLPALKAAVDQGADAVYLGLKDNTNARNFAGLNFDEPALREGIRYAQSKGRKVLMALNTYPQPGTVDRWHRAVDKAAEVGAARTAPGGPGHPVLRPPPLDRRGHQRRAYREESARHGGAGGGPGRHARGARDRRDESPAARAAVTTKGTRSCACAGP